VLEGEFAAAALAAATRAAQLFLRDKSGGILALT
jgi:hypothetical protein